LGAGSLLRGGCGCGGFAGGDGGLLGLFLRRSDGLFLTPARFFSGREDHDLFLLAALCVAAGGFAHLLGQHTLARGELGLR